MNWNKYRRNDGTINLVMAYRSEHVGSKTSESVLKASIEFLLIVENYQEIRSRQVAALALAQADILLVL